MSGITKCLRTATLVLLLGCVRLWGQATAQISGTVRDQSGAVLPGVEVTVTQTDTGIGRSALTNETGSYALSNLPIGPYRFEASLPGFRTFVQMGIVLQVNASPVVNPILEVGQVVILFDPIFQGLAISLMAGEVASLLLSRMTVPILFFMTESRKK